MDPDPPATGRYLTDTVTQIETNLDDLSPEIVGATLEKLLAAGALDAFFTPAQMKKNRPGILLTVLCEPAAVERVADVIFCETTAFGLRLSEKRRLKLDRRFETVPTAYGDIQVKLGSDRHGALLQASPEYESCRVAAEHAGASLREVYAATLAAFSTRQK